MDKLEGLLNNVEKIDTQHNDLIHDIAFDHHGKLVATCSGDQTIRIWKIIEDTEHMDTNNQNNSWVLLQNIGAEHTSPIRGLAWAHPCFGTVLASCSTNGKVVIYRYGQKAHNAPPTNRG